MVWCGVCGVVCVRERGGGGDKQTENVHALPFLFPA